MNTYTQEQQEDIKARSLQADHEIKAILDKHQLSITALPAFTEITAGQCVAVGIVRYNDTKFSSAPVIETDEAPVESAVVTNDLVGEDVA